QAVGHGDAAVPTLYPGRRRPVGGWHLGPVTVRLPAPISRRAGPRITNLGRARPAARSAAGGAGGRTGGPTEGGRFRAPLRLPARGKESVLRPVASVRYADASR